MTAEVWSAIGSIAQAATTIAALIVAIFAARYAKRQVDEAKRSREAQAEQARQLSIEQAEHARRLSDEQARPFVTVDFEPSETWVNIIELVIRNVGKTLAKNVQLAFSPPLQSTFYSKEGKSLSDSFLISKGILAMPPGKHVQTIFDISHDRAGTDLPMQYTVRVDYENYRGEPQETLEYILDLEHQYDLERVTVQTVHDASKNLEKISKTLDSIQRKLQK